MVENCLVLLALLAMSNTRTLLPTTQPQETLHCMFAALIQILGIQN